MERSIKQIKYIYEQNLEAINYKYNLEEGVKYYVKFDNETYYLSGWYKLKKEIRIIDDNICEINIIVNIDNTNTRLSLFYTSPIKSRQNIRIFYYFK